MLLEDAKGHELIVRVEEEDTRDHIKIRNNYDEVVGGELVMKQTGK